MRVLIILSLYLIYLTSYSFQLNEVFWMSFPEGLASPEVEIAEGGIFDNRA